MNVPAIRKALERLSHENTWGHDESPIDAAVVRVGLRACDEWDAPCPCDWDSSKCNQRRVTTRLEVIADILREAGVEVEG